jgi:hypothetical protein
MLVYDYKMIFLMKLKLRNMKRLMLLFFTFGILFTLQSCNSDDHSDNPDNLTAPIIPSTALFTIPTQSFGLVGDKESASTRSGKSNWIHAGLNVLVWNSVVFVNTAVPIAAFGHAFDYEAGYIGNLTWEWKYQYQSPPDHGAKKYDVSLTGKYINDGTEVAWTMTVNEAGDSNKFIWYEGVVSTDHTGGIFTINHDPLDPQPYMSIAFSRNSDTQDVTIRFSNVLAGDPGIGDYIEWRTHNGNAYDRAYDVFTDDSLLEIEANQVQKNGRVKHPAHFNDNEWHCWDTFQFDIDC